MLNVGEGAYGMPWGASEHFLGGKLRSSTTIVYFFAVLLGGDEELQQFRNKMLGLNS